MGAQVRYGSIAVGAYYAHQPGSHQRNFGDQYHPRWDRGGGLGPRTWKDRYKWTSGWSYGCRIGGGEVEGYAVVGRTLVDIDLFEPYSCDGSGTQTMRFFLGTCVDASEVAVANPIVQGFITGTDTYIGEVTANNDGTYVLPTNTISGVQHYLVAYKAGSPDIAGTTVNTLTSTNVDGT